MKIYEKKDNAPTLIKMGGTPVENTGKMPVLLRRDELAREKTEPIHI